MDFTPQPHIRADFIDEPAHATPGISHGPRVCEGPGHLLGRCLSQARGPFCVFLRFAGAAFAWAVAGGRGLSGAQSPDSSYPLFHAASSGVCLSLKR